MEGHVNTHSNPIPKAGPGSGLGLGLSPGPSDELIPNPRSQTSFSDVNFSITAIRNPNILFEFDSDLESTSDSRVQNDILLRFESDSGVDEEEDIEDPESMENQEIDSNVHAGGMSRRPGDKYTEFDFDFLDEDWLEITDDNSDDVSSSSSSCATDR